MKENNNIEELFKQKFENFEGNVDPSAWNAIQQSVQGAAGSSSAAGLSGFTKVASIVGLVGVTSLGVWYASADSAEETQLVETISDVIEPTITIEEEKDEVQSVGESILVADTSDPVIQEKKEEIEKELNNIQYNSDDIDNDLLESVLTNHSVSNGFIVNQNVSHPGEVKPVVEKDDVIGVNDPNDQKDDVQPIVKPELKSKLQLAGIEYNTVTISSNAKNHSSVEWSFGDGNTAVGDKVEHTYERPGTYEVVMNVYGDGDVKTERKKVIIEGTSKLGVVPNVFTPNGDGRNDYFKIKTKGLDVFYISIQDQKGTEVFTSNDPYFEWDGMLLDGSKASGSYIVVIIAEGEDGQLFKEMKALRVE